MSGPGEDIRVEKDGEEWVLRRKSGVESGRFSDFERAVEEARAAAVVDQAEVRWTDEAGEEHVEEHVDDAGLFD
ncbi:MAG: hypothetical protein M3P85_05425 [Actinomycetota bacterium]|nr:hypothetical protein [Actinomycetota bacterium]